MAYVNSGIVMKNTHYDWRVILVIAIFFVVVTALVVMKVIYPDFEPGKLLSGSAQLRSVNHATVINTERNSAPAVATSKADSEPLVKPTQSIEKVVKAPEPKPIAEPIIVPVKAQPTAIVESSAPTVEKSLSIVCSAEDREAQFCQ